MTLIDETSLTGTKVDGATKAKTAKIRASSDSYRQAIDSGMSQLEETIQRMTEPQTARQASAQNVGSVLDQALAGARQYETDMQGLVGDFVAELQSLGTNVEKVQEMNLIERGVSLFNPGAARKMVLQRLKEQPLTGSMRSVIVIARNLVQLLETDVRRSQQAYAEFQDIERQLIAKIDEAQPRFEHFEAEVTRLQASLDEIDQRIKVADRQEYADLQAKRAELQAQFDQAEINRGQYHEIVRNAQESLPVIRLNAQTYRQTAQALAQSRTRLNEQIATVAKVFTNVGTLMEIAFGAKGFGRTSQVIHATLDTTTDQVVKLGSAILEEHTTRGEAPLIDPAKLEAYLAEWEAKVDEIDERMQAVRTATNASR